MTDYTITAKMTDVIPLTSDDGVVFDAVREPAGRFFHIRANGVVFSHAMIAATAQITMEEAAKCWNGESGLYTYETENPFPQYVPAMVEAFPQYEAAIRATAARRRRKTVNPA